MFDKKLQLPSVKVTIPQETMENTFKSAGKTLGVLGAFASTVAQGADLNQLKAQFQEQVAQAPESVTKVLQSGEGCDVSLLNNALESNDYSEYMACGEIEKLKAEIGLANAEQALAKENQEISELISSVDQKQQNKNQIDSELTQTNANIDALSKRKVATENRILANLLN